MKRLKPGRKAADPSGRVERRNVLLAPRHWTALEVAARKKKTTTSAVLRGVLDGGVGTR